MKEYILAPSLFSSKISRLEKTLETLEIEEIKWLHVDVMDGYFVPDMASGPSIVKELKEITDILLDVHLMVETPEKLYLLSLRLELTLLRIMQKLPIMVCTLFKWSRNKKKIGVAINPATPVSLIAPILAEVDLVLVMTINPGRPNRDFIPLTVNKIAELSQLRESNDYHYLIEVDGKIDNETIKLCANAGTDMFVSGGYILVKKTKKLK